MRKLTAVLATLVFAGALASTGSSPAQAEEPCRVKGDAREGNGSRFSGTVQHDPHGVVKGTWHHQKKGEWRLTGYPDSLTCRLSESSVHLNWSGPARGDDQKKFLIEVTGTERTDENSYRGRYGIVVVVDGRSLNDELDVIIEVTEAGSQSAGRPSYAPQQIVNRGPTVAIYGTVVP